MGGTDAASHAVNPSFADLMTRARGFGERRALLGICGPPGAGKSTLAQRLVSALGVTSVYIGMDGFHLAQAELARLGRTDRKGAPDTFDAAGYVHLLRRLREQREETVYAPEFHRDIEEPVAGAVPVQPAHQIVITEGNYLLLADPPWQEVRTLLDEIWFLAPDETVRRDRLIARHQDFGRTLAQARERAFGSDERNAVLINATKPAADLVIEG
jgi:pantothenate kinase